MSTEKQIAANRRNALKSTGPRTLAGKVASARWRLMRMSHVEAVNVDSEFVKQIDPPVVPLDFDTADRTGLASRPREQLAHTRRLRRAEVRLQRQFHAALTQVTKMRAARGAVQDERPKDAAEIDIEDAA